MRVAGTQKSSLGLFWQLFPFISQLKSDDSGQLFQHFGLPLAEDFLRTLTDDTLNHLVPKFLVELEEVLNQWTPDCPGCTALPQIRFKIIQEKAKRYLWVGEWSKALDLLNSLIWKSTSDNLSSNFHHKGESSAAGEKSFNPGPWLRKEKIELERSKVKAYRNLLTIMAIGVPSNPDYSHGEIVKLRLKSSIAESPSPQLAFEPEMEGGQQQKNNLNIALEAGLNLGEFCQTKKTFSYRIGLNRFRANITGASYSAAVAALIANDVFYHRDRIYYKFRASFALTGDIDSAGYILPVNPDSLKMKLESIFWSPIETIAIPASQAGASKEIIEEFKKEYPHRRLDIISLFFLSWFPQFRPGTDRQVNYFKHDADLDFYAFNKDDIFLWKYDTGVHKRNDWVSSFSVKAKILHTGRKEFVCDVNGDKIKEFILIPPNYIEKMDKMSVFCLNHAGKLIWDKPYYRVASLYPEVKDTVIHRVFKCAVVDWRNDGNANLIINQVPTTGHRANRLIEINGRTGTESGKALWKRDWWFALKNIKCDSVETLWAGTRDPEWGFPVLMIFQNGIPDIIWPPSDTAGMKIYRFPIPWEYKLIGSPGQVYNIIETDKGTVVVGVTHDFPHLKYELPHIVYHFTRDGQFVYFEFSDGRWAIFNKLKREGILNLPFSRQGYVDFMSHYQIWDGGKWVAPDAIRKQLNRRAIRVISAAAPEGNV